MISTISPLENLVNEYDSWFQKYPFVYESELEALNRFIPSQGMGIEISVNTGRFAAALGIKKGVEYYPKMKTLAKKRGIEIFETIQEVMPFSNDEFDFCLLVDPSYLHDIRITIEQIHRILKPGGKFILGFIEKNSAIGKLYEKKKADSEFYASANFYSISQINEVLSKFGFKNLEYLQTLFGTNLSEIKSRQIPKDGYGIGSFIIIKAHKL